MSKGHRVRGGRRDVRFGMAELIRDLDRPDGWLLSVDGVAQSYVDLDDPTHLEFDYVRRIGDVIDCLPEGPLNTVHIGGGACTLPRYVAATRPGSRQLVLDPDEELIDMVRERLDLRSVPSLRVRISDGREGLATRNEDSADLIVLDAFVSAEMPGGMATVEFARDVRRVLRPHGTYLMNVTDGPGWQFARRVVATVAEVFDSMLLLADPSVMRGRRFGNLVVAASAESLPEIELARRAASAAFPARLVTGEKLLEFYRGAKVITDAEQLSAPTPPETAFT
ncbi:methyltransferase domain-containing protein [Kibdelosporangium aridum]|uniref:Methyltransferase domain-containing protein n=1 Tax=Kibdelosporangium aridum TaxID=2030 RepID=A0A428ZUI1_KIBAR|nr:fused MFS/spermidine synthase [Kibdelosporangium aridum]RSM91728.1 methyltransferase domain-containing protein [Kibdelosporangium aridum]